MANANVTANTLTEIQIEKYSRRLLVFEEPNFLLHQFAQKPDVLESGAGKTMIFTRFIPIGIGTVMTNVTHASGGEVGGGAALAASKKTSVQQITVTPVLYADGESFDLFDNRTAFINWIKGATKSYGDWYGKQIHYKLVKTVSTGALHVRADWDGTYQVSGRAADASSATTYTMDAENAEANDFWNGGYITYLTGKNKGITRAVTDSVIEAAGDGKITHAAFPHAPVTGDKYIITVGTGLTTGDTVDKTVVGKAVAYLEQLEAPTIDGYYVGYIDSRNKYDFLQDITPVRQYTEIGIKQIYKNEIGEYGGVRWIRAYESYRESVAGVEARGSGAVFNVLIFGRDAFGEIPVQAGPMKPELNVNLPGPQTVDIKGVNRLEGIIGIKQVHCPTMLNALSCISVLSVPTDTVDLGI